MRAVCYIIYVIDLKNMSTLQLLIVRLDYYDHMSHMYKGFTHQMFSRSVLELGFMSHDEELGN